MLRETPSLLATGDCRERLARWAGCDDAAGGSAGEIARVAADYLRHGLCHLGSEGGAGPARSVHVHQLMGTLRRQLGSLVPEPDEPPWHSDEEEDFASFDEDPDLHEIELHGLSLWALRRLALLGDCGHRGHGYYLPTPARTVALPSGNTLLLGGIPTRLVAEQFGCQLQWAGLARILTKPTDDSLSRLPEQSLDEWVRRPVAPLAEWTEGALSDAVRKGVETSGAEVTAFEIYAPHLTSMHGQRKRWVPPKLWRPSVKGNPKEVALCRTRMRPYRYWIALLANDHDGPRYRHESAFPREQVRRLMYGLDLRAKAVTSARVLNLQGSMSQEFELRLYNWPAPEEYRLLQALAFDATPMKGPHIPLRFHVAASCMPDVVAVLAGLSIPIDYDQSIAPAARLLVLPNLGRG